MEAGSSGDLGRSRATFHGGVNWGCAGVDQQEGPNSLKFFFSFISFIKKEKSRVFFVHYVMYRLQV